MNPDQIQAFVITLALEVPFALWWTSRWPEDTRPHRSRVLLLALAASMITHPFLYGLVRWRPDLLPRNARIAIWESVVVLGEALVYARGLPSTLRRALGLSLGCNAVSLLLPMAIWALW